MIAVEFGQLPLDSAGSRCVQCIVVVSSECVSLSEMLDGQVTRRSVIRGDFVDNLDSLFVPTTAHQVLRAFIEFECEESDAPQDEHQSTHGEQEISPSLIFRSRAGSNILGDLTGVVSNQWPGDLRGSLGAEMLEERSNSPSYQEVDRKPTRWKERSEGIGEMRGRILQERFS